MKIQAFQWTILIFDNMKIHTLIIPVVHFILCLWRTSFFHVEKCFPPKYRHFHGSYDDSSCCNEQSTLDNVKIDTLITPVARFVQFLQRTRVFPRGKSFSTTIPAFRWKL